MWLLDFVTGLSSVVPLNALRLSTLPQFQGNYSNNMLWGTYRPGLYFGAVLSLQCEAKLGHRFGVAVVTRAELTEQAALLAGCRRTYAQARIFAFWPNVV